MTGGDVGAVNRVEYGLTASIYTSSLANAHRAARRVESGYIWINNAGPHFVGVPFGGYKQSGIGREESIKELYTFTQTKNIHITLRPAAAAALRTSCRSRRSSGSRTVHSHAPT